MVNAEDAAMEESLRAAADDVAMELYATGFNAWNQLTFNPPRLGRAEQPDDIFIFTKVLSGNRLDRPKARLSYTTVRRDNELCLAGSSRHHETDFGDINNAHVGVNGNGSILLCKTTGTAVESLSQFSSLENFKKGTAEKTWSWKARTTQIAAYDLGFVVLYDNTTVFTLGSPRFADCLGREVNESSPAGEPSEVTDLSVLGDPIKKVAAGGYNVAALTQGGALYVWGAQPTKSQGRHQVFPDINGTPNYIEVDGDKDVTDIALGESHAIALTSDGCVYVIGANTNGQLGLGRNREAVDSWTKLDFELDIDREVVGVEAGPRSSFLMTS